MIIQVKINFKFYEDKIKNYQKMISKKFGKKEYFLFIIRNLQKKVEILHIYCKRTKNSKIGVKILQYCTFIIKESRS